MKSKRRKIDIKKEMEIMRSKRIDKKVLAKVRKLNDEELRKLVEVFDACVECWDPEPEKCKYQPIRKKIGLPPCDNLECKKRRLKEQCRLREKA